MRSFHKDSILITNHAPGPLDKYGRTTPGEPTTGEAIGRVVALEAPADGARPMREFEIRVPITTPLTMNSILDIPLPEGGRATAKPLSAAIGYRSPYGAATGLTMRVRVADLA